VKRTEPPFDSLNKLRDKSEGGLTRIRREDMLTNKVNISPIKNLVQEYSNDANCYEKEYKQMVKENSKKQNKMIKALEEIRVKELNRLNSNRPQYKAIDFSINSSYLSKLKESFYDAEIPSESKFIVLSSRQNLE